MPKCQLIQLIQSKYFSASWVKMLVSSSVLILDPLEHSMVLFTNWVPLSPILLGCRETRFHSVSLGLTSINQGLYLPCQEDQRYV
jgi:hypothetical protein